MSCLQITLLALVYSPHPESVLSYRFHSSLRYCSQPVSRKHSNKYNIGVNHLILNKNIIPASATQIHPISDINLLQ